MEKTVVAPVHSNFDLAYTEGHVFTKDAYTTYSVSTLKIGDLKIHSGKIMACDPGIFSPDEAERYTFVRPVPKGEFPVLLSVVAVGKNHNRIGAIKVQFSNEKVAKWEMALRSGQRMEDLEPDQFFGYPVDCGIGCVADPATFDKMGNDDWTEETTETLFADMDENDGDWGGLTFPKGNLLAAHSGWGDGTYASYFGLDAAGKPVCFVTDFEILVASIPKGVVLTNLPALCGKKVEDAELKEANTEILVQAVPGKNNVVQLEVSGDAAATVDIDYEKTEGVKNSQVQFGSGSKSLEIEFENALPAVRLFLEYSCGLRALE